jgi:D-tyrosyl-tRNA(Tyr) deacylase
LDIGIKETLTTEKGKKKMRFVIQRVTKASVTVEENVLGKIDKGFMVLIGVSDSDTKEIADKMVRKMIGLRIFEDNEGKTNLSLDTVEGELLLVSQFTLYANCKKGNRPSFIGAGAPDMASDMYEYIIAKCKETVPVVERGEFGADMKVELVNDGPFTIVLDSEEL